MRKKINFKVFLISLAVSFALAALFSYFTKMPLWGSFLIIVIALFVNGIIANIEDKNS